MGRYISTNELYHKGVLGMKWHHHKAKEEAYRSKLTAISTNLEKNGNNFQDAKRIKYRNQSVYARVGKTIGQSVASMLISDLITGRIKSYGNMNKIEIAKKTLQLTKSAAVTLAMNEALAKSASNKYDNSGKQIKGKKNPFITREDAIANGIKLGMIAAPFAKAGLSIKAQQKNNIRRKNDAIYRSRGSNLLSDKTNSFVYGSYSVK